jgi:hypothetical protein
VESEVEERSSMSEILDREEFRLWLATREPDEPVATESEWIASSCAAATYLRKSLGYESANVGLSGSYAVCEREHELGSESCCTVAPHVLPWLREFVHSHDDAMRGRDELTAKEALTILDSIEEPA